MGFISPEAAQVSFAAVMQAHHPPFPPPLCMSLPPELPSPPLRVCRRFQGGKDRPLRTKSLKLERVGGSQTRLIG